MARIPSTGALFWVLLCALVLFLAVGSVRGNTLCSCGRFGFRFARGLSEEPYFCNFCEFSAAAGQQQLLAPAGGLLRQIWLATAGEDEGTTDYGPPEANNDEPFGG